MKKKKISIVVPCYNEEESVPLFYKEMDSISQSLNHTLFEFLFINDGSSDKTLEEIRLLAKQDERVRYLQEILEKKLGCMLVFLTQLGIMLLLWMLICKILLL